MTRLRMLCLCGAAALLGTAPSVVWGHPASLGEDLETARLPLIATVSDRFLSYNVEMVELTGGRFWKPYRSVGADNKGQYEYRAPIDLSNVRLRKLAAALGPAYVRYSGTWANATVYLDTDSHEGPPPAGYDAVLTRGQWKGAVAFAKAVDARIVTSMPTSAGSRDAQGLWQSGDADRFLQATRAFGGKIWASEFANEPNLIGGTKPPEGYAAEDYRRDYARFHGWIKERSPETLVLAPGAFEYADGKKALPAFIKTLSTDTLLPKGDAQPDVVSFHFYGAISQRCGGSAPDPRDAEWLSMIDGAIANTDRLRREVAPGAPMWLTETAESACGGNPQASSFADSFRFVDQLAKAARHGVAVVMHNTLAASDYALLDEQTFAPRPNYWAAYLWRQLMGHRVLDAGSVGQGGGLRIYAQCLRDVRGGVAVLAINPDRTQSQDLSLKGAGRLYSLTQADDAGTKAALNGNTLALGAGDQLPKLEGARFRDHVRLAASSINFIALPNAHNPSCT